MKTAVIAFLISFATAAAAGSPSGSLEFVGYLSAGPDRLFVLFDPTSKERSPWMKVDESWHGHRLVSYDAQRETLVVARGVATLQLNLRTARVVDGRWLPRLLRGSFSTSSDAIVYSTDAEISIAPSWIVRAVSGTMTYNSTEGTIRGDLLIDNGSQPLLIFAKDGVVKLKDGSPSVSASKLMMKKRPNAAPEPTPMPATSPTAQEPRQP